MHWAYKIASEVVAKRPNLKEYVVASGITPSGSIHIGNYREFITNYYVGKALKSMGKKVRMIFSWDDYDRFRKVPKNVTNEGFDKYLGMPVSAAPNPFDSGAETFARHFQLEFEQIMQEMGNNEIPVEFIYQHKKYTSGAYNKKIIEALQKRKQIFDIITSFKTQEESDEQRENYFPVSVYCKSCNKDFTTVISFNEKNNQLTYECKCRGTTETIDVATSNNVKLVWKVDWPMRWQHEGVVFEAAGIDHHSENGSFAVGRRISKEIFGYDAPETCVYAWVGIKGVSTANMSSSSGVNITPRQLLNVYEPEIIRWLFAKYHHEDSFDFGFDDIVPRHYTEFDRYLKNAAEEYEQSVIDLALFTKQTEKTNFQDLIALASAGKESRDTRFGKVMHWLTHYMPSKLYKFLDQPNKEFYSTLSPEEKEDIKNFATDITQDLYSFIGKDKARQKRYFNIFYNLLFGRDDGPRLQAFLSVADKKKVLKLLNCA